MDHFAYHDGHLYCESLTVRKIVDRLRATGDAGTPTYVYSLATLLGHYRAIDRAFADLDPLICYSIKSCGNVHLLRRLAAEGAGMDVVSGGEIHRAMLAGVDPAKIVYAGVGKTTEEIEYALTCSNSSAGGEGIGWFNIESEAEFENISAAAQRLGREAHGTLRVNPDVADSRTHAKTTTGSKETKFGVDIGRAVRFFQTYGRDEHCRLDAVHLHIGSPIYSPEPYVRAIEKALSLIGELRAQGFEINTLDIGGGFAADYESGASPAYRDYADALVPLLKPHAEAGMKIILEPGRTIAGNAGLLVTQVQYVKDGAAGPDGKPDKRFVIADAGMHNLLRPSMYDAFHFIWPCETDPALQPPRRARDLSDELEGLLRTDIVGPICETGDSLSKGVMFPPVQRGDLLGIFTAGAYGMVMASQYNAMPRPAEVLVDTDEVTVIRSRENYEDLTRHEEVATALADNRAETVSAWEDPSGPQRHEP